MQKRYTAEQRKIKQARDNRNEGDSETTTSINQTVFKCPICAKRDNSHIFFDLAANLNSHVNFYHEQEYKAILAGLRKQKQ